LKPLIAFFRLIRWPNLLFIIITQVLFMYCVISPIYDQAGINPFLRGNNFFLLCLSSVLIAAAGYMINDYFDLNIDLINKPHKIIVDRVISRRWTIILHFFLSITGIAIGFFLDFTTRIWFVGITNLICALALFLYSVSLKRKLLIGNILISLLTAWVILVIPWCENKHLFGRQNLLETDKILRISFLYAGFAFIISLIREVVKDMEDTEGDKKQGCTTMPIVWGIPAARIFATGCTILLIIVLLIVQVYLIQLRWWFAIIYFILLVIIPLFHWISLLFKAHNPYDFHRLSTYIKLIMLAGIVSLLFFRFYP